jgi:PKD repeat protein
VGSSVLFTNTSTGTTVSTTYSWNFGLGATPATATTIGPHTVTYTTTGPKTVSLTVTDGASNTETQNNYITVNPLNTITLTSGAGTNNQTVCVNTPITTITYSTIGATGASVTGLPSGVTGNWAANVVTISGAPTTSGTFNYSVTLTGGCGTVTANGTITVNVCTKTLNLTSLYLEGLYNGSGTMRQAYDENGPHWPAGIADHINVELHGGSSYLTIVYTANDIALSTTGAATVTIPAEYSASYYITVRHRNHIETTTALPVSFSNATITYAFDTSSKAFGSNLKLVDEVIDHFVIYGADVNQDGFVDSGDYPGVVNDNFNYVTGYLPTDINGDGFIDSGDYPVLVNNNYNYVTVVLP